MRASFFTPLCLTVGALQKTYESDSDSDSNKVVVFQVNMKVSYEMLMLHATMLYADAC